MASIKHITKRDIVAVIVLVVFLLLNLATVGASGRRRAKEFVCQSNLRQWALVFQNCVRDNNGQFLTGDRGSGFWWPVQLDERTQSWKQNKTWFCPTATSPVQDEYDRVTGGFTRLSAWGVYASGHSRLNPDGIAGSYALNGYMLDIQGAWGAMSEGRRSSDFWKTLQPQGASRIPLMLDATRFDVWPSESSAPPETEAAVWPSRSNHMASGCINRHDGAVNCLFADGSVRKVGLKELWTLKWHRTFNTQGPWTQAGGVGPQHWPQWMREFKEY